MDPPAAGTTNPQATILGPQSSGHTLEPGPVKMRGLIVDLVVGGLRPL